MNKDDKGNSLYIPQKEILNFKEASTYLGVSKSFLYKLTASGKITHYKPSGKLIYFKRSDLDTWLTSNKCESVTDSIQEIESFISNPKRDKND